MLITKKYDFHSNKISTGKKIKELRGKMSITAEKLALKLSEQFFDNKDSIDVKSINNWEQGYNCPSIENLFILSKIFNVSVYEILLPNGYMAAPNSSTNIDYDEYFSSYLSYLSYCGQFVNLYTKNETNIKNIIDTHIYIDYLIQKLIFSFLTNEEKEYFYANINDFYVLTLYGYENYDGETSIYNIINDFVNKEYGYCIKQKTPDDNKFNEIMLSIYRIISRKYLLNDERIGKFSKIFYLCIHKFDDDILDKILQSLNMIEKDCLLTVLLMFNVYCKKFQVLFNKLIRENACCLDFKIEPFMKMEKDDLDLLSFYYAKLCEFIIRKMNCLLENYYDLRIKIEMNYIDYMCEKFGDDLILCEK